MTRHLRIAFVIIATVPASVLARSDSVQEPKHLVVARNMVAKLDLSKTSYKNGTGKVSFVEPMECHTDCSGFLNYLLKYTYDYNDDQLQKWFSAKRPQANKYHDVITKEIGFKQITLIQDTLPGDLMAIKYLVRKDHTGHAMLVSGTPKKMRPTEPLIPETVQWEVKVIDAFLSAHGPTDKRYQKGNDDRDHGGLGEGILRIYADKEGKVAGYSWSTLTTSRFVEPAKEHLVIGRLKEGFRP
ncbi:MAG TPA: hypothetical protein VE988_19560 [Gemmataceae bacterium]|nr:hypothetical protein [Gemmataceae bacterium]